MATITNTNIGDGTPLAASFDYVAAKPLDSRTVVEEHLGENSSDGLKALVEAGAAYNGLQVYVENDKKTYEYKGGTWTAISYEHEHPYLAQEGTAVSANKVKGSLTITLNDGTTEGTDKFVFNGSADKVVNIQTNWTDILNRPTVHIVESEDNKSQISNPKYLDICIVKAEIYAEINAEKKKYQHTAYVFNGTNWAAMDGNYSAKNVFTAEKITLAGEYSKIGNYSKGKVIEAGTSLQDIFSELFQTTLQPEVIDPTATISASGSQDDYEVGTSYTLPTAELTVTTGTYTYDTTTGVKFPKYSSQNNGAFQGVKLAYGSDPDATGASFVTNNSDLSNNGSIKLIPSTYSSEATTAIYTDSDMSYTFSGKAYHTEGTVAKDNLKQPSNPEKKIVAGEVTVENKTAKFRGFRYMFAGGSKAETADSDTIRALGSKRAHTDKPSSSNPFEFTAAKGSTKVIFAFPAGRMSGVNSPKFQIFTMAWGDTTGFVKSTVDVADARGDKNGLYTYDVYTYTPATPLEAESTSYRVYF